MPSLCARNAPPKKRKGYSALCSGIESGTGHARETYPHESDDCNLADLAAKWGVTTVRCIVLVKDSIRIADEIANVSKGCEGIVHLH